MIDSAKAASRTPNTMLALGLVLTAVAACSRPPPEDVLYNATVSNPLSPIPMLLLAGGVEIGRSTTPEARYEVIGPHLDLADLYALGMTAEDTLGAIFAVGTLAPWGIQELPSRMMAFPSEGPPTPLNLSVDWLWEQEGLRQGRLLIDNRGREAIQISVGQLSFRVGADETLRDVAILLPRDPSEADLLINGDVVGRFPTVAEVTAGRPLFLIDTSGERVYRRDAFTYSNSRLPSSYDPAGESILSGGYLYPVADNVPGRLFFLTESPASIEVSGSNPRTVTAVEITELRGEQ